MFELDGDFDLDEDFLQGVFETETEVTDKITRIEAKGEKRFSLEEDPCLATKKHKLSSNDHGSSQCGKTSLFEGSGQVMVNSTKNNKTETSGKLDRVLGVSNINLNASETEIHVTRNDTCIQASFRMQLDDTCSAFSSKYTDTSTTDTHESRISTSTDGRHRGHGDITFKGLVGPGVTPQHDRFGRTIRQRKFPGPAGLLPDKDQMMNQSTVQPPIADSETLHNKDTVCFQSSDSVFEAAAWLQMLRDFELSDNTGPLSQFTVAWVKRRAAARQLVDQKVPFLVTVLRDIDCSSPDPCVVLQDRTGEVHGTLHREVWEQYGGQLQPGSVLVLRQVGVLSTGITARRHYLNVTCNNIINIYSNVSQSEAMGEHSSEVRTTRVQQMTHNELLKSVSDWQAYHSAAEAFPVCRPVNSMFSTVGSPINLPVSHCNVKQSGNITRYAPPLTSCPDGRQQALSSVPKFMYGTSVPQSASEMLQNSVNNRDSTMSENSLNNNVQTMKKNLLNVTNLGNPLHGKLYASTVVKSSTPSDRSVMDHRVQSVYGKSAPVGQNVLDSPQQIRKDKSSNSESFKFQLQPVLESCGRKSLNLPHKSDEGETLGSESLKFQLHPAYPSNSKTNDSVTPKFKGGFIPKVSHFGNLVPAVSQVSNTSEVRAVPHSDFTRTLKPTVTVANLLHKTSTPPSYMKFGCGSSVSDTKVVNSSSESISRSSKCLTEVECSALDVLEGLDTSSFFDEF